MEFFGLDVFYIIGVAAFVIGLLFLLLAVIGSISVFLFLRIGRITLPKATLWIVSSFESPIKRILTVFGFRSDVVDRTLIHLRNGLNARSFASVAPKDRALFLPQCLRHPECPAKLSPEGIMCVNCGRCGVGMVKKEAELLGYKVFIAPGGSLVKRMARKYKPKAVLGVGCNMEIKEGAELMDAFGIPAQGVALVRDGCIDTRADIVEVMKRLRMGIRIDDEKKYTEKAIEISRKWKREPLATEKEREEAKEIRQQDIL